MRVGYGYDAHRFDGNAPLVLGGVTIPNAPGVAATSDGDVIVHALVDAILGACALGDLGSFYPSDDPRWAGARSIEALLPDAVGRARSAGWSLSSVDCTVIVESVRISPYRQQMRVALAAAMDCTVEQVSVKATTSDGLGAIGAGGGIAVHAVAVVVEAQDPD